MTSTVAVAPPPDVPKKDVAVQRSILISDKDTRAKFCDNHISTGKYSLLSFVPVSLFEQ